jgi:hypothetical protein
MKGLWILSLVLLLPLALLSEPWILDSDISLTINQSTYSESWAGTELSNITWAAMSNSSAEKQLKPWLNNKTTLKLAFGQTHLQKQDAMNKYYWDKPVKSTDKIDLESVLRFTTQSWVDPFIAARMESQFLDLSDPALTRIINPMLFTETAGAIRTFTDTESNFFSSRLGAAFRQNVNREVLQTNLIDRETETSMDGGLEMVSEYKHMFSPMDANFKSRLQVYQALYNSKSDELNEDWKSPDVVWENVLTTKLWGLLSANVTFEMRYEKEQIHKVQWKEILGLGFSYSLF